MKVKEIKKIVKESSYILIGLGASILKKVDPPIDPLNWDEIKEYNGFLSNTIDINSKISKIFNNKDYFIISTSWNSNLSDHIGRVFTPNGSCNKLQCYNACTEELWDFIDFKDRSSHPKCPYCNSPLIMNITTDTYFVDEHLQIQEKSYYKWIHKNYNNKILLLEIETSELDTKLIKGPFENIATALPNVTLLRVNSSDLGIPSTIKKQYSFKSSPETFFKLLS
ncbi:hypothetical protein EW093_15745 [Thiospirochaeta perfilievii]|uniref:Deacetylase sirtuin-type domain-containing protein n=1 Tax=Thiospirochaeta perfilievii TaxID=252967 RepID=A0A5C1QHP9_9SPIO|nr:hypothetical protein [Thiospirochaeta perfilievii]QEN06074.1 hypothetical protein EW093_15745 [Thiospirochaeta perfilievii]